MIPFRSIFAIAVCVLQTPQLAHAGVIYVNDPIVGYGEPGKGYGTFNTEVGPGEFHLVYDVQNLSTSGQISGQVSGSSSLFGTGARVNSVKFVGADGVSRNFTETFDNFFQLGNSYLSGSFGSLFINGVGDVLGGPLNGFVGYTTSAPAPNPIPVAFANIPIALTDAVHLPGGDNLPTITLETSTSKPGTLGTFRIDVPLYFNEIASGPSVLSLESSWLEQINKSWGGINAINQYGDKYDIVVNAYKVFSPSDAANIVDINLGVGFDDHPCRFNTDGFKVPDCPLPAIRPEDGHMEMYENLFHFCMNSSKEIFPCTFREAAGTQRYFHLTNTPKLVKCKTPSGETTMCIDTSEMLNLAAAHEFGHLLGLNDEYTVAGHTGGNWLHICYPDPKDSTKVIGCEIGQDVGLMGSEAYPVQARYMKFLLSNLGDYTPGFSWTFGNSPEWNDGQPIDSGAPYPDDPSYMFISDAGTAALVDEPSSLVLIALALTSAFAAARRGRRAP